MLQLFAGAWVKGLGWLLEAWRIHLVAGGVVPAVTQLLSRVRDIISCVVLQLASLGHWARGWFCMRGARGVHLLAGGAVPAEAQLLLAGGARAMALRVERLCARPCRIVPAAVLSMQA
jgi:hypothetical protein